MIRIAIIGDIGAGKSYVAKQFGFPVFNADREVAKIYKKNKICFRKLKKILPNFIKTFPTDKKEITSAILSNSKNLKKIIKIVHPEVRSKMRTFIKKHRQKKFLVLDIPLILENKISIKKDIIIFVDAKKKEIDKKLKKRHNINLKVVKKFRKIQLSLELKRKKSNFIIKNNFKNNSVKNDVKYIKKYLINDRSYSRH
jgi:dephospho-CoA kinase